MTSAWAGTTADCGTGDAPSGFDTATCDSVCTENAAGDTWTCDLSVLECVDDGGQGYIVHDYKSSGHDLNGWGACTTTAGWTKFCCTFNDDTTPSVTTVKLLGSEYSEEILAFTADNLTENLGPHWATDMLGFIYGDGGTVSTGGSDLIQGSNYSGNSYRDNLYGDGGDDTIYGYADGDFIRGDAGDDTIYGGPGDDRILGGTGDDDLNGDNGNDALCDHPGVAGQCEAVGANYFDGGDGHDTIWYVYNPVACTTSTMNPLSTGGNGNNVCGSTGWDPDLPGQCTWSLTSPPSQCDDPNL